MIIISTLQGCKNKPTKKNGVNSCWVSGTKEELLNWRPLLSLALAAMAALAGLLTCPLYVCLVSSIPQSNLTAASFSAATSNRMTIKQETPRQTFAYFYPKRHFFSLGPYYVRGSYLFSLLTGMIFAADFSLLQRASSCLLRLYSECSKSLSLSCASEAPCDTSPYLCGPVRH